MRQLASERTSEQKGKRRRQHDDDDPDGVTSESPALAEIDTACADHDVSAASAALPRVATAVPQTATSATVDPSKLQLTVTESFQRATRRFFSFVEATSRFLGSYEKALASFSSFWNVIRLPVTRSVGLKGQGGPGVSETRGGARGVICRRHEAPPRVTERPSATIRLRHPVPALPPLALLAPATRASEELILESRVRRTVCFGCSNRQPTMRLFTDGPPTWVLPSAGSLSSAG